VNPNPQTTWACVSTETTSGKIRNALAFFKLNASDQDPRLLCHSDSTNSGFYAQPHAAWSPDGQVAFFGSDQNNSGRIDAFLAIVPTT
jgi:hypothetical protein